MDRGNKCYIVVNLKQQSYYWILEINLDIVAFEIDIIVFIYMCILNTWLGKIETNFRTAFTIFII